MDQIIQIYGGTVSPKPTAGEGDPYTLWGSGPG